MSNKKDHNFTQEIVLPSRGLLTPDIPGGKVVQRCMMVADQKFLSGSSQSAGSALHQLLQRTVTSPENFKVEDLTVADTLYLLFKLRVLSYGKEYSFKTRCPECGRKITVTIDLSELPVETLEEDYTEKLSVVLPHRGDTVYTKVMTNKDSEAINSEVKRRKRRSAQDDSEYILRIVYTIDHIKLADTGEEISNPIEIEQYVSSLTDLDASAIMSTRNALQYGITPSVEYVCPECKEYIDINMQFSGEFFRPHFSK